MPELAVDATVLMNNHGCNGLYGYFSANSPDDANAFSTIDVAERTLPPAKTPVIRSPIFRNALLSIAGMIPGDFFSSDPLFLFYLISLNVPLFKYPFQWISLLWPLNIFSPSRKVRPTNPIPPSTISISWADGGRKASVCTRSLPSRNRPEQVVLLLQDRPHEEYSKDHKGRCRDYELKVLSLDRMNKASGITIPTATSRTQKLKA